jgi:hypothetical protein
MLTCGKTGRQYSSGMVHEMHQINWIRHHFLRFDHIYLLGLESAQHRERRCEVFRHDFCQHKLSNGLTGKPVRAFKKVRF